MPDRPKWLLAFTVMVLVFVLVFSRMWRNGNGTLRGEDIRNRRKGGGKSRGREREREWVREERNVLPLKNGRESSRNVMVQPGLNGS